MDPEVLKFVWHMLVGVAGGGGLVAVGARFVLKYRQQTKDELSKVLAEQARQIQSLSKEAGEDRVEMRARITQLETQIERSRLEHNDCLQKQAELRAELVVQKDTVAKMHAENRELMQKIYTAVTQPTTTK
jgi:chromosome segregation ATPase